VIPTLLLVDLHLQLVDDAQQVQLDYVELEFVVLVLELLLHTFDIQLSLQEAALGPMMLDIFK
jgi:hypothetical protein